MSQNPHDGPRPAEPRPDVERAAPGTNANMSSSPAAGSSSARPAQFYSPPPSAQTPESQSPGSQSPTASQPRWQIVAAGVLVAAAVIGGAIYGFSGGESSATAPVAAATEKAKTFAVAAPDADPVATAELKAFLSGSAAAGASAAVDRSINGAALKELNKSAPKMAEEIKSGRRTLYRVFLLDFLQNDSDYAELFVDGVSLGNTQLTNAGTAILIPLPAGVPVQMKLVATGDGGGGVTVGFVSSVGEARTRVMQVGEFEQWQVIVQ